MTVIPQRPLGFGEILDGAIQFYRRDFGLYFLIALVGALPGYAMVLAMGTPSPGIDASGNPDFGGVGFDGLVVLLAVAVSWVGTLAVAVAMRARLEGGPASLESAYRGVLRPFPSAIGAHLLAILLTGIVGVALVILVMILALGLGAAGSFVLALVVLVPLSLVAALLVLALWFSSTFAILPAVLLEGRSAGAAIKRSFELTRGARLRVLGIMLVVFAIQNAVSFGLFTFSGGLDMFTSPATVGTVGGGWMALQNTLDLLIGSLTGPFLVATVFFLYHDRRVRLEASDLETTAAAMTLDGP
ncbi:hypothetical protein [Candidatus Palauibacter sp.]|uniref:hypothetical protein n=1 Tax=Candidatus Palauibacter sp. TaxID=3101350 RepID=UPI003AF30600